MATRKPSTSRRPADSGGTEDNPPWTQAVQDAYNAGEHDRDALILVALEAGADAVQAGQTVDLISASVPGGPSQSGPTSTFDATADQTPQEVADDNLGTPQAPDNLDLNDPRDIAAWLVTLSPSQAQEWVDQADLDPLVMQLTSAQLSIQGMELTNQQSGNVYNPPGGEPWDPTSDQVPQEVLDQAINASQTPSTAVTPVAEAAMATGKQSEQIMAVSSAAVDQVSDILYQANGKITPGLSDTVAEMAPTDLSPTERNEWVADVLARAQSDASDRISSDLQATGQYDAETADRLAKQRVGASSLDTVTPVWMLEMANAEWTPQEQQRLVDYYNDTHGARISSFAELAPIMAEHTADNEALASAALAAQEPQTAFSIGIPGMRAGNGRDARAARDITLSGDTVERLMAQGFTLDSLTRMVRIGGLFGLPGQDSTADKDRVEYLAAIIAAGGGTATMQRYAEANRVQQEVAQLEKQMGLEAGELQQMTLEEQRALRAKFVAQTTHGHGPVGDERGGSGDVNPLVQAYDMAINKLAGLGAQQVDRGAERTQFGAIQASTRFNKGLEQYHGSSVLALIYSIDPHLADVIHATGGDPDKLDPNDNVAALRILDRAGVQERNPWKEDNILGYITSAFGSGGGGGGGGGAGPIRRIVDPVSIKDQVQQLWQAMRLDPPSDTVVNAIVKDMQSQLDKAPEGMTLDQSARIMEFLRQQPQYGELYAKKPGQLNEAQFQAQFVAGQQSMLGAEATGDDAIRAGMRTGEYQTTVGSAFASEQGKNNSTLQGRLARAAQVISELT